MSQDQQEIPGQRGQEFRQTTEVSRELKLIEEAQDQGILNPTVRLLLYPEPTNKITKLSKFSFQKSILGLRIEGSWMVGQHAVSLLPIGLQVFSETSESVTNQEWTLLFMPLRRITTAVTIPNSESDPPITGINVALPLKEWPTDKLSQVVDLITYSRKKLIYPLVDSRFTVRPYDPSQDIWQQYLNVGGKELPKEVGEKIKQTQSSNQIKYSGQFQGV